MGRPKANKLVFNVFQVVRVIELDGLFPQYVRCRFVYLLNSKGLRSLSRLTTVVAVSTTVVTPPMVCSPAGTEVVAAPQTVVDSVMVTVVAGIV
jgi:hypothetical protein